MDEAWSYQYFSTSDYDMDRTHQSRWNMNGNLYCPVSYILLSPAKDEKNKIKITSGGNTFLQNYPFVITSRSSQSSLLLLWLKVLEQ